ncbi:hypothetical protein [Streptomyces mirabilis]
MREHTALRTGPRALVRRDQVHPPGAVFQLFHLVHGQAVQVEQQRRRVV